MNLSFSADGYDISIDVNRCEEPDEQPERKFRTGFCLPPREANAG